MIVLDGPVGKLLLIAGFNAKRLTESLPQVVPEPQCVDDLEHKVSVWASILGHIPQPVMERRLIVMVSGGVVGSSTGEAVGKLLEVEGVSEALIRCHVHEVTSTITFNQFSQGPEVDTTAISQFREDLINGE